MGNRHGKIKEVVTLAKARVRNIVIAKPDSRSGPG